MKKKILSLIVNMEEWSLPPRMFALLWTLIVCFHGYAFCYGKVVFVHNINICVINCRFYFFFRCPVQLRLPIKYRKYFGMKTRIL